MYTHKYVHICMYILRTYTYVYICICIYIYVYDIYIYTRVFPCASAHGDDVCVSSEVVTKLK